jgi:hypothetical protein
MAATTSSAEKEGNLLAHSTRRQRGNFDAPGHLLSFRAREEQKSHSKSSSDAGIFSIQPSGDWQRAFKLGSRQKHSQINPIIRISSDGFPRAF